MAAPRKRYFINRSLDAFGEVDPAGPLEFNPPKDSDELFEALKEAFPHIRTHKERMREAVIEFHVSERDEDSKSTAYVDPPFMRGMSASSWFRAPAMTAAPSQSSMQSSPDYLPSPKSLQTTFPSTPAMESQSESTYAVPSSVAIPNLKEMTNVWSISTSAEPKIRTRRTMTDAEKKEYRRKRIGGACTDCRRRRQKCDHDSSESESSARVKKSRKTSHTKKSPSTASPTPNAFLEQSSTATTPSMGSNPSPPAPSDWLNELPSSALWTSSEGLSDFSWMSASNDFLQDGDLFPVGDIDSQSLQDPIFDLLDLDQTAEPLAESPFEPQSHSPVPSRACLSQPFGEAGHHLQQYQPNTGQEEAPGSAVTPQHQPNTRSGMNTSLLSDHAVADIDLFFSKEVSSSSEATRTSTQSQTARATSSANGPSDRQQHHSFSPFQNVQVASSDTIIATSNAGAIPPQLLIHMPPAHDTQTLLPLCAAGTGDQEVVLTGPLYEKVLNIYRSSRRHRIDASSPVKVPDFLPPHTVSSRSPMPQKSNAEDGATLSSSNSSGSLRHRSSDGTAMAIAGGDFGAGRFTGVEKEPTACPRIAATARSSTPRRPLSTAVKLRASKLRASMSRTTADGLATTDANSLTTNHSRYVIEEQEDDRTSPQSANADCCHHRCDRARSIEPKSSTHTGDLQVTRSTSPGANPLVAWTAILDSANRFNPNSIANQGLGNKDLFANQVDKTRFTATLIAVVMIATSMIVAWTSATWRLPLVDLQMSLCTSVLILAARKTRDKESVLNCGWVNKDADAARKQEASAAPSLQWSSGEA